MVFEILKENINLILMIPKVKILEIRQHVKQKTNADNSYISFKKQHQKIHRNGKIRVQKMKSDTSPVRIENRIGKKMVQINQHRSQQNKIHPFPIFTVKN